MVDLLEAGFDREETISIRHNLELTRRLGIRWVLWRLGYALRMKSGLLKRRFPAVAFDKTELSDVVRAGTPTEPEAYHAFRESSPARFLFQHGRLPASAVLHDIVTEAGSRQTLDVADDFCRGRFLYFSRHVHNLGWPVDWLLNPFTGGRHDARTHWCDYATFAPGLGDIKDVWEPSRFACAYWLVRAYALTGDEKYPKAFWDLFESWCRQNPPNMGPNWKCGQETAFRTMAWCFALYGFWHAPATTARRVADMVKMIAIQAHRIARNIDYAISQNNNHSISEAVGLLTVALLFPELRGCEGWLRLGRDTLESDARRQIYRDGSFVQHSTNYHRVMLHDYIWAIRLAELNGKPLSRELTDRVAKAGEFLFQVLDVDSGRVPNYGANDGALILPLAACDYVDHRPTVQAARYQATGQRTLGPGPWDEMPLWLFGDVGVVGGRRAARAEARGSSLNDAHVGPESEGRPTSQRLDAGGYYTLRGTESWCMIRCHSFRSRPAQVDMLHLDLWYKGINVLGDSGSYRYYDPENPLLERYFKDISAHNTVEIDDASPLELFSRFIWLPWPKARCLAHESDRWQGEHFAYRRSPWNVTHRRSVVRADEHNWEITDEILGQGRHRLTLRWHLADGVFRLDEDNRCLELDLPCGCITLCVECPAGFDMRVCRGAKERDQVIGWRSDYYGECVARPTVEVTGCCTCPARFVTRICLR